MTKFKLLSDDAVSPTRATVGSAGYDVVGISREWNEAKTQITYRTGVALGEVPAGYFAALFPRSSIVNTDLRLANSVGVIDPDYTGEIVVVFDVPAVMSDWLSPGNARLFDLGTPCAQILFLPCLTEDEVPPTTERDGGFGSTMKRAKR